MLTRIKDFLIAKTLIIDRSIFYLSLFASIAIIFHLGSKDRLLSDYYFKSSLTIVFSLLGVLILVKIAVINYYNKTTKFRVAEFMLLCYFVLLSIIRGINNINGIEYISSSWLIGGIFAVFLMDRKN